MASRVAKKRRVEMTWSSLVGKPCDFSLDMGKARGRTKVGAKRLPEAKTAAAVLRLGMCCVLNAGVLDRPPELGLQGWTAERLLWRE